MMHPSADKSFWHYSSACEELVKTVKHSVFDSLDKTKSPRA